MKAIDMMVNELLVVGTLTAVLMLVAIVMGV